MFELKNLKKMLIDNPELVATKMQNIVLQEIAKDVPHFDLRSFHDSTRKASELIVQEIIADVLVA